ncbi:unnamed protein product [Albugo candida]|uniref:Symplekin C-terminal domain-containing protein n=1 Tax=Albugo candida TaxID=65357 RepID=A0A024GIG2_9STRA|nr:unnamed protein product [Albugo candida]|eukprot:CCI46545.1 unnamed protein product [Albugo candida]
MAEMESQVRELFTALLMSGQTKKEAKDIFSQIQELVLNRDTSGLLLQSCLMHLKSLYHLQNASLLAAIIQFISVISAKDQRFLKELFDIVTITLISSHSTEKNILKAVTHAQSNLNRAMLYVYEGPKQEALFRKELWNSIAANVEQTSSMIRNYAWGQHANNLLSVNVYLRVWKYLEQVALVLSEAKEYTVYRDLARSNIQPDVVTLDKLDKDKSMVELETIKQAGYCTLLSLCFPLATEKVTNGWMVTWSEKRNHSAWAMAKRDLCIMINSLSLLAGLRPYWMSSIVPVLLALFHEDRPKFAALNDAVSETLASNLIKLLSIPDAQPVQDEITECLIALRASGRAFRAISKSKEPRRKYVSAPSEASLRKARLGKRTAADALSERRRKERLDGQDSSGHKRSRTASIHTPASLTHDGLVNVPAANVVEFVLDNYTVDLPIPPPAKLKLQLFSSELKNRALALLQEMATPSSVLAMKAASDRMRALGSNTANDCAVVSIFDEVTSDDTASWISKNASTIAEPLVDLAEDNTVQVYLKAVSPTWCHEMALGAFSRILENVTGVEMSGGKQARHILLCRLATILSGSPKENDTGDSDNQLALYYKILDCVLEDYSSRFQLAGMLLVQVYSQLVMEENSEDASLKLQIYRSCVRHFFSALASKYLKEAEQTATLTTTASARKIFTLMVNNLPVVCTELVEVLVSLCQSKHGIVLGITLLRDLLKERKSCFGSLLQILLSLACNDDKVCRNTAIRCIVNQLCGILPAQNPIEKFSIKLVKSLGRDSSTEGNDPDQGEGVECMEVDGENSSIVGSAIRKEMQLAEQLQSRNQEMLFAYVENLHHQTLNLTPAPTREDDIVRRLELHLALCAKKPQLLSHIIKAYSSASESAHLVMFHIIEKLIKHLKQRGSEGDVIAYLKGFDHAAVTFICHIIQILCHRSKPTDDLVLKILKLYQEHTHVTDAISILIPILPVIKPELLLPLLPDILRLPAPRLSVAFTRLLEVLPPYVTSPHMILLALHKIEDSTMQEKATPAIKLCLEQHKHAFPPEVLGALFQELVELDPIPKLTLYTINIGISAFPIMKDRVARLLSTLAERRCWEMDEMIWREFVKCSVMTQPASLPMLLEKIPVPQLEEIIAFDPSMRNLLYRTAIEPIKEEGDTNKPTDVIVRSDVMEYLKNMGFQEDTTDPTMKE